MFKAEKDARNSEGLGKMRTQNFEILICLDIYITVNQTEIALQKKTMQGKESFKELDKGGHRYLGE